MNGSSAIRWLTGYSGWMLYCALISTFGVTGYYSELLQDRVPPWLAVGVFITPMILIIFVVPGEAPDRLVVLCHVLAACWFMALALGMEAGALLGFRCKGEWFYRTLAHLGWTFAWAGILRRALKQREMLESMHLQSGDRL